MSRDFYGDARVLAVQLADVGLDDWACKLEDMIEAGATSSEILMGLRWHLRQLMEAVPPGLTGQLRTSALELAGAIDEALN